MPRIKSYILPRHRPILPGSDNGRQAKRKKTWRERRRWRKTMHRFPCFDSSLKSLGCFKCQLKRLAWIGRDKDGPPSPPSPLQPFTPLNFLYFSLSMPISLTGSKCNGLLSLFSLVTQDIFFPKDFVSQKVTFVSDIFDQSSQIINNNLFPTL